MRRFRIVPTRRPYVLHLARRELGQRGGVGVEWDDEGSVRVPGPAKATRPVSVPRVHDTKTVHERVARLAPRRLFSHRRRRKRAAVVFAVIRDATRAKRVDDRAQGHAAAVRERGVGWEQGGAQAHACLRKCFGTRDVARRGGESRRVAWRDPERRGSRFSRLGSRFRLGEPRGDDAWRWRTRSRGAGARTCEHDAARSSDPKTVWPSMERALAVDDALFFEGVPFGTIEPPKTGSWCVGINPSVIAPRPCRPPPWDARRRRRADAHRRDTTPVCAVEV